MGSRWSRGDRSLKGTSTKACHQLTALLQGRDEGQRRFGSLVGVAARRGECVVAAAGSGIVHRHAAVVAAEEPSYGAPESGRPVGVLGDAECTSTGIGDGGRLDGLLVEARPGLAGRPPADGREREVVVARLDVEKPVELVQAGGEEGIISGGD